MKIKQKTRNKLHVDLTFNAVFQSRGYQTECIFMK